MEVLQISPFIRLEKKKYQNKNSDKKLSAQVGVLMVKLWPLVRLEDSSLSDIEILIKSMKSNCKLPFGVCNGVQLQTSMTLPFA